LINQTKYRYIFILIIFLFFLSACQTINSPQITIENPWGRPSPKVATAGAFYMVIKNSGGQSDTLLSASSPSCGVVELHESYDKGDGVMGMREVEGGVITIPAKSEVQLKMGGLHIMCIDKLDDFQKGSILKLILKFEVSGSKSIDVEIREPSS